MDEGSERDGAAATSSIGNMNAATRAKVFLVEFIYFIRNVRVF